MVEVLVVDEEHWRSWRRLRRAALADAPGAFGSTLFQWSGTGDVEARWRARLREVALNLVLALDGQPAGMVSATAPQDARAVELISLWVAPHARGRGVGDAAVREVLQWARQCHPNTPIVLAVTAGNEPAAGSLTGTRPLLPPRVGLRACGGTAGPPTRLAS